LHGSLQYPTEPVAWTCRLPADGIDTLMTRGTASLCFVLRRRDRNSNESTLHNSRRPVKRFRSSLFEGTFQFDASCEKTRLIGRPAALRGAIFASGAVIESASESTCFSDAAYSVAANPKRKKAP
jgi:hypothetical protein